MALMTSVRILLLLAPFLGPRLAEARLGNTAQDLTESTLQAFLEKNDKVLVDFYDPNDAKWREGARELESAVKNIRSMGSKVPVAKVDASKEKGLAAKYVPDGKYPSLHWFVHAEATQYHRRLGGSKAISDFVMALDRDAMVSVASEEASRDFVPSVFARVSKNSPMFKTLEIVASKHMDQVAFTFLESTSNDFEWLAADVDPLKYKGEVTVAAIEKWVRLSLLKSEAIPEDPALLEDEGSKVVVGKNFEDIVLQQDKDVILQIYAPWCGFCKKFSTVWNSFAQEVADVQHLVVAKMDGSRNGSPLPDDFAWESYPKVFYVKAGAKKPVHFEGERSVENLISFVGKHTTKPILKKAESRAESEVVDL